ncbi:MAG: NAD(P)-dependent oxidoreductase [Candidatus Roizmanbacteria bacterium]|nr:NAD(P)-dependent oxidoreductase [Candidatus Roizmanbacteria bacterium]
MGKIRKTIFITGAGGFIGKNLTEQLNKKYNLLTPRHKDLDLLEEKAVDNFFKKNKIDVVINCAVIGGSRKEEHVDSSLSDNLRIFFNLLKNKDKYKKMIHLGSGAEYDKSKPIINVKESDFDRTIPQDEYGFFKYICSKYIEKEKNIVCLRIFGLFGKFEDYRYRFISNAIVNNIKGLPITINQNVFFDYLYIDDFVKIVDYFISNNVKQKFYNIGTGKKIDILTIAKKINLISDKKSKIIIKSKGLNNEYSCDNQRLINELKKFKFASFDQSLRELYLWYKTIWKKN